MKKPAQHLTAEVPRRQAKVEMTIGIDLGDVWSHYCTLNQDGEVVDRGRFRTTPKAIEKWFTGVPSRLDPNILRPIAHRSVEQQQALTLIRARALMVRLRTAAVNAVRGLTKSCGYRMPASATTCFAQRSLAVMPPGLAQALGPVLQQIAEITIKIKQYDRQIQ
jgi:transposase